MKYAFVECQRGQHSVRTLCRALRVSPSGYYAARSRPPSARDERQSSLTTKIRDVHLASRETYGAPRVHAELSIQGIACCRNTVAKLMRRAQIVPQGNPALPSNDRLAQYEGSLTQLGETVL